MDQFFFGSGLGRFCVGGLGISPRVNREGRGGRGALLGPLFRCALQVELASTVGLLSEETWRNLC